MWFWWFMFICNILIPVIMVIAGRMMWKHAPTRINGMMGYRTSRSMKNMDTWRFAHAYCGKLWWKIGWIMLVPSIVVQLPFYHGNEDVVGTVGGILCMLQCVILVVSIFPTEKALKKNFTDEGIRRTIE